MRVAHARVFDSEVLSLSSSSVRDSVKQRKHNDQTVLQVVSEAQLCADLTVDDLFCVCGGRRGGEGVSRLPLHTYGKGWKWRLRVGL